MGIASVYSQRGQKQPDIDEAYLLSFWTLTASLARQFQGHAVANEKVNLSNRFVHGLKYRRMVSFL